MIHFHQSISNLEPTFHSQDFIFKRIYYNLQLMLKFRYHLNMEEPTCFLDSNVKIHKEMGQGIYLVL
jgi:hypothetical protein